MKRFGVVVSVLFLVWSTLLAVSAYTAQAAPPPVPSSVNAPVAGAAATTAAVRIDWSVKFGSGYGTHPVVNSDRNPSWSVSSACCTLTFQVDCNLVARAINGGGAYWASNSVAGLRPCKLDFQLNGDVQIRNAASQLGWHTNVIHSGTVFVIMAFYDTGCLIEWYWNVPTQHWLNQWAMNDPDLGCASYTSTT